MLGLIVPKIPPVLRGGFPPPQNNVQCTNGPPNVPKIALQRVPQPLCTKGSPPPIVQFHRFLTSKYNCFKIFSDFQRVVWRIHKKKNKNRTRRLLRVKTKLYNGGGTPPPIIVQWGGNPQFYLKHCTTISCKRGVPPPLLYNCNRGGIAGQTYQK